MIPACQKNSYTVSDEEKDKLRHVIANYHRSLNNLDHFWVQFYQQAFFNSPNPIDKLDGFWQLVYKGIMPPDEIITYLAEAFRKYLQENGRLTLEEAFCFPKRKQSSDHPIGKSKNQSRLGEVLVVTNNLITQAQSQKQNLSVIKAAKQAIQITGHKYDARYIEKKYSEYKVKKIMADYRKNLLSKKTI